MSEYAQEQIPLNRRMVGGSASHMLEDSFRDPQAKNLKIQSDDPGQLTALS
jgi:hypothetical protein